MVEVCAADLTSVMAAVEGGAGRIELCDNLSEGGTTPSLGMVMMALQCSPIPVRVLIRPRPGDFTYTNQEAEVMKMDIEAMKCLGVEGFVLGALTPWADIDVEMILNLLKITDAMPWTFHRAFDFCANPFRALETIISLGADTLLTSGQAETALQGAPLIRQLRQNAGNALDIMAGAGITQDNILEIKNLTGCTSFHLSGRKSIMNHLPGTSYAKLNAPGLHNDTLQRVTDAGVIRQVVALLSEYKQAL